MAELDSSPGWPIEIIPFDGRSGLSSTWATWIIHLESLGRFDSFKTPQMAFRRGFQKNHIVCNYAIVNELLIFYKYQLRLVFHGFMVQTGLLSVYGTDRTFLDTFDGKKSWTYINYPFSDCYDAV